MPKKFSIIVPIYKIKEEYLRQCIESLINQTFSNIEIHLMDDGSPDKCGQICDEYAQKDERIIVHHLINGGLSYARNSGLDCATGEYIIFLDADDWINVDFCNNMNDILSNNEDIDVICTCYCYAYQNGKIDVENNSSIFNNVVVLDKTKKEKLLMAALYLPQYLNADIANQAEYSITMWGKVFKRDFLKSNQLRCVQGISPFEDNIFYSQMLVANPKMYFDTHISYNYRINEQSVTQRRLNHEYEIRNLCKTFKTLKSIVSEQYLMALFTIMRLRQVAENIFQNTDLQWNEKKSILNRMRFKSEIVEQLQMIKDNQYDQQCHKGHRLFYKLFSGRHWALLNFLFVIKKGMRLKKADGNTTLVRFQ